MIILNAYKTEQHHISSDPNHHRNEPNYNYKLTVPTVGDCWCRSSATRTADKQQLDWILPAQLHGNC